MAGATPKTEHLRVVLAGRAAVSRWRGRHAGSRLDLSNGDLYAHDLSGYDLRESLLRNAVLDRAKLLGTMLWRSDLTGASLTSADLSGADLRESTFVETRFDDATLFLADLRGTSTGFSGASFARADLRQTDLRGADFRGAEINAADLSRAKVWRADFANANLARAKLEDVHAGWASTLSASAEETYLLGTSVRFSAATLTEAVLDGADLPGAQFSAADLRKASLRETNLQQSALRRTDLEDADLSEANLCFADLTDANLTGANLRGARLIGANFARAHFRGANVAGAVFGGNSFLGARLDLAAGFDECHAIAPSAFDATQTPPLPLTVDGNANVLLIARQPDGIAGQLSADLRNRRVRVWPFPESIQSDINLAVVLEEMARTHKAIVIVGTSIDDGWLLSMTSRLTAKHAERVVLLRDCPPLEAIASLKGTDGTLPTVLPACSTSEGYEHALAEVVRAIQGN